MDVRGGDIEELYRVLVQVVARLTVLDSNAGLRIHQAVKGAMDDGPGLMARGARDLIGDDWLQ